MFFSFAFSVFLLTQPTRYMGIETLFLLLWNEQRWRHNLLAIWVLKLSISSTCIMKSTTQPTRYMGIETFSVVWGGQEISWHNLLAIWVLKLNKIDTVQPLTGHNLLAIWVLKHIHRINIIDLIGHNLLAIWVLKPTIMFLFAYVPRTQPTRYMGIETQYRLPICVANGDTTYSLYGYWNIVLV